MVVAQRPPFWTRVSPICGTWDGRENTWLASLQFTKSLLVYIGMPGKVRNDDVAQKKALCSSATKMQLGSECHPGSMGFVYVEFLVIGDAMVGRINIAPKMAPRKFIMMRR
jgi:hypothetical protein